MEIVDELMQQAVEEKVFPGAVLEVSRMADIIFSKAYGLAQIDGQVPATLETVFDLASLTKPLATTLAVIRLVQNHKIGIAQTLAEILPEFDGTPKARIKLKHLLYHNSGLPDYRPYYQKLSKLPLDSRRSALRQMLVKEPLIQPVGKEVLYSDLGFMILSWGVERVAGLRLDHFVGEEIYQPLGLKHLFFNAHGAVDHPGPFAATENCLWRRKVLVGQVHDENAFAVGGVEGHAGLFGTAGDVHSLLIELLRTYQGRSRPSLFDRELLHQFFKRLPGTDKAMGFDMPRMKDASCGQGFSTNSVGHLGFTGTSFWMDLERAITVILLTNRVHPTRDNECIKKFRPHLHDTIINAMKG
jgi:CubicO group peptidase (beta-lactamase class C family)